MAVKVKVTKEFSIGQNVYKVDGEVLSFSDELAAKHSKSLEKVTKEPKAKKSKIEKE